KVVTKSGDLDGTYVYYYADTQAGGSMGGASPGGWSIAEIRDGSANVLQQVYHGTQYIDEIVAMRLEKGYAVVYQDANWNTLATCDLAGRVLERVFTTPYGAPIIEPETFFGDYDGDGDVDSTDDASLGSGQTCWGTPSGACRIFDFNQDGTLNASDETVMTALVAAASTNRRHENRTVSPIGMTFVYQGLQHDPAVNLTDNRFRLYLSILEQFLTRDPIQYKDGIQLYARTSRNPIVLTDPTGGCKSKPQGGDDWPTCCELIKFICDHQNPPPSCCNKAYEQCKAGSTEEVPKPCHAGNVIDPWCHLWRGKGDPCKPLYPENPRDGDIPPWIFQSCDRNDKYRGDHCTIPYAECHNENDPHACCLANCNAYCDSNVYKGQDKAACRQSCQEGCR
ncbi:MAG: hypothetical protein IT449_00885, partial [Phycisphaerales bacterium]|nr:hypothetical protein [Phycisphaerales bacterium]